MGAQWKNANKSESNARKGAVTHKLSKEIMVAAKVGDPNPDSNPRLRAAVETARRHSVSKDTIERAIKKGAGFLDDGQVFETVLFEGFAPHKIPVIVECLTDNKNRTSSNVRVLFSEGSIGKPGSVAWMFDRLGVVEATHKDKGIDIEAVAIEAGAQNVEPLEETPAGLMGARFFTDPKDLDVVSRYVTANAWTVTLSELSYIAKDYPLLDETQKKKVVDFLSALDSDDDVHRIYAAMR